MTDDPRQSNLRAQVYERGERPPGIISRHAQAKVLGGIAVLMILAMAFSGAPSPKRDRTVEAPAAARPMELNQARIQEYRARIEEQTRKLAMEQAQLAQAKEALGAGLSQPMGTAGAQGRANVYSAPSEPAAALAQDRRSEEKNLLEKSLFSSNIALSMRGEPEPTSPLARAAQGSRREEVMEQPLHLGSRSQDDPVKIKPAAKFRIMEGTLLETVLTNRLDGSFSGPVNCLVTADVYSRDRRKVLIPQGSRVLGEARHVDSFGQKRIAVTFHRLLRPDGESLSLNKFQGLNQIGETGLRDRVNHHYLQVFGVSVALGMLAGFSQANTQSGFAASGEDAYRQGVANSLSQSSLRILDRYLNVLPTFTIREGHRIKVYLTADLLVPAYASVDDPHPLQEVSNDPLALPSDFPWDRNSIPDRHVDSSLPGGEPPPHQPLIQGGNR